MSKNLLSKSSKSDLKTLKNLNFNHKSRLTLVKSYFKCVVSFSTTTLGLSPPLELR